MLPTANGMPATFHCQDCGAAAEPDARFCAGCGHELRRTA
jgi:predicted nucleic acid-binding Zn ribbon protein